MTAYTAPTAWYISSAAWTAASAWTATHSYTAGTLVRQSATPTVGNERIFACTVAGTSGGSEPTWVVTKGAKTTDNTVTWIEVTGQAAVNGDVTTGHAPVWALNLTPTLGVIIYDSVTTSLQVCTASGAGKTSGSISFSATAGVTTTDASATWTSLGATSNFGAWAAPHARGSGAFATNWSVAGNDFYFADNHAETSSSAVLFNCPGAYITFDLPSRCISIDHTLSVPPTGVKSGASVTCTSGNLTIASSPSNASAYYYGFTFAASANLFVSDINGAQLNFDTCVFDISSGSSGSVINVGNATDSRIVWNNCGAKFSNGTQSIRLYSSIFIWKNSASAILGSTLPTGLIFFPQSGEVNVIALLEGLDLSPITGSIVYAGDVGGYVCIKDCKLASGVTTASMTSLGLNITVDVVRSDSSGTNYRMEHHTMQGDETTSTTVVRTGGATDGVTPVSHQISTNSAIINYRPFEATPIAQWNSATATNLAVTLYGVMVSTTRPTNAQFWFDVEYLGVSGASLGSFVSGGQANVLASASNLATDTSAWNSAATARANTHTYTAGSGATLGSVISVPSAPAGMIFFCTAGTGSSASSVPGGYASATDGAQITDGGFTFTAGYRFSLTLTLSSPQPAQVGYLYVYPKAAAASAIFFIDPLVVL